MEEIREEVRRELVARFGEKTVYEGGLTVRTSYTRNYQEMADKAFRDGLIAYDRRHGWRGTVTWTGKWPSRNCCPDGPPSPNSKHDLSAKPG